MSEQNYTIATVAAGLADLEHLPGALQSAVEGLVAMGWIPVGGVTYATDGKRAILMQPAYLPPSQIIAPH